MKCIALFAIFAVLFAVAFAAPAPEDEPKQVEAKSDLQGAESAWLGYPGYGYGYRYGYGAPWVGAYGYPAYGYHGYGGLRYW